MHGACLHVMCTACTLQEAVDKKAAHPNPEPNPNPNPNPNPGPGPDPNQEAVDRKAAQREVTKARVAEKYDDAGAALVTAAQSARFNRRMRGAAQACPKRPHA